MKVGLDSIPTNKGGGPIQFPVTLGGKVPAEIQTSPIPKLKKVDNCAHFSGVLEEGGGWVRRMDTHSGTSGEHFRFFSFANGDM